MNFYSAFFLENHIRLFLTYSQMSDELSGADVLKTLQQTLNAQAGQSVEGIALVEILSTLRNIRCVGTWKSAAGYILRQAIYIYLIMMIKKYMSSVSKGRKDDSSSWDIFGLSDKFKSLLEKYYVNLELCTRDSPEAVFWKNKYTRSLLGFEIIVEGPGCSSRNSYSIQYIPLLHQNYVNGLLQARDIFLSQKQNVDTLSGNYYSHDGTNFAVARVVKLYPSANYRIMTNRIRRFLLSCELTGNRKPLGLLINGAPGLGKTELARFLPYQFTCNTFRINASEPQFSRFTVGDLMAKMWTDRVTISEPVVKSGYSSENKPGVYDTTTPMVIFVDELDKWVNMTAKTKANDLLNMARNTAAQRTDGVVPPISSEADIKRDLARDLAQHILGAMEKDNRTQATVLIFCSNNFSSIFSLLDEEDRKHLDALNDRFIKIEFQPCNRDELCEYLRFHNDLYRGTELYCSDLEQQMTSLRTNILLTYRRISQIMTRAQYELVEAIMAFNKEPNFVPPEEPDDIFGNTHIRQTLEYVLTTEVKTDPIIAASSVDCGSGVLSLIEE